MVSKIAGYNVEAFSDEFEILKIDDLPDPEIDCKNKNFITKKNYKKINKKKTY